MVGMCFFFSKPLNCIPKSLYDFTSPPAVYRSSIASLGMVNFFHSSHYNNRRVVMSHCSFSL